MFKDAMGQELGNGTAVVALLWSTVSESLAEMIHRTTEASTAGGQEDSIPRELLHSDDWSLGSNGGRQVWLRLTMRKAISSLSSMTVSGLDFFQGSPGLQEQVFPEA